MASNSSTWLRPLDRNETACLQKGYKPIRLVYTEQPLTARILVDGSKTLPIDDLIREFFSLHRMLLSKTQLDDIDICLLPHCDIREITVNQLTKLNGHQEPVLLLTARSNSEYLLTRDLEELTFRQQTGLNVDISVLNNIKQDNERLREENQQQNERIIELEKQISDLIIIRDEMKKFCKDYKNDLKKNIDKNDEYYKKFERLDQKLNKQLLQEQNVLISTRLKSE
ncbi:unnamed protein product [Rotaria sordida]|uniref:Uncharacterized protein n=1 Tax=Rotaria sordida TaxID=392033 RepID=A0A813MTM3_9BILA|nr:unnamed protein product [Rotaria sordida]CAF0726836.1 unnamed protein product [Rotaria sordida]CAF0732675.1 unnamed protein product [Rotaria sordida]CAF0800669.1 unnamed protein product [Rotaria sordida]CAF3774109.1 unnamed protein product [Rotaria sordida]